MAARPIVAVLTGASRGIGRSIYEAILNGSAWKPRRPEAPVVLFATSRSGELPPGCGPQPSQSQLAHLTVIPTRLSLIEVDTIEGLVREVQDKYGGCDVLINNAGVYHYRESITPAERDEMLEANFFGAVKMCEFFIPIMRDGGRIVNVSSQSGQLQHFSVDLRQRFLQEDLTLSQLAELIYEYRNLASKGLATDHGWPPMTYFTSKAGLNAATRILARDNPQLLINCCCPGWVDTELGGQAGRPPKTPDQGARIPLRLAFGDIGNITGRYWANPSVAGTGYGDVRPW